MFLVACVKKVMAMLRDKVQEQSTILSHHVNCKERVNELEQLLKESQHAAVISTQQAEVSFNYIIIFLSSSYRF